MPNDQLSEARNSAANQRIMDLEHSLATQSSDSSSEADVERLRLDRDEFDTLKWMLTCTRGRLPGWVQKWEACPVLKLKACRSMLLFSVAHTPLGHLTFLRCSHNPPPPVHTPSPNTRSGSLRPRYVFDSDCQIEQ